MQLRLIRNATLRLSYGGRELLVDPSLDPAGAWPEMQMLLNPGPNPRVELPVEAEDVVDGIDGVLVSHLHIDHFDARARELIPRQVPLVHQPADKDQLEKEGFEELAEAPPGQDSPWLGLQIRRVGGEHGFGVIARAAGPVSGFVVSATGEPVLYVAGDTVWCGHVETVLERYRPDVVVVNAGDARTATGDRLIMDGDDVELVLRAAPDATVVAVHLEAISHCVATRADLRRRFEPHGPRFVAPDDGETLSLTAA